VGPFPGIGVRRHRPPGIRFADLPTIDVVLLSHDHYDHMDIPTLRRLVARDHPRIIAGLGNAEYLAIRGVPGGVDLDWWQSEEIGAGLRVVAVPARHWSGRGIDEHDRTLWAGFMLETTGGAVYFAGDTGHGQFLELIHRRFPSIRLALLPIAPERPRAALAPRHMSAGEAVHAARLLGAGMAVGIHFGTFRQGDDADGEAVDSLRRALLPLGGAACDSWFTALRNGGHRDVPPLAPINQRDGSKERARNSAGCTR
jgi:L-ascorbate metabolism protein UlaG (beta-lactamase superfamily)